MDRVSECILPICFRNAQEKAAQARAAVETLADLPPAIHPWATRIRALPGYGSTYPPKWCQHSKAHEVLATAYRRVMTGERVGS